MPSWLAQWWLLEAILSSDAWEELPEADIGKGTVLDPGDELAVNLRYLVVLKYDTGYPPERAVRNALRRLGGCASFRTGWQEWPAGYQMYVVKPSVMATAADYKAILQPWGASVVIDDVWILSEWSPFMWDTSMDLEAVKDRNAPLTDWLVLAGVVALFALALTKGGG